MAKDNIHNALAQLFVDFQQLQTAVKCRHQYLRTCGLKHSQTALERE